MIINAATVFISPPQCDTPCLRQCGATILPNRSRSWYSLLQPHHWSLRRYSARQINQRDETDISKRERRWVSDGERLYRRRVGRGLPLAGRQFGIRATWTNREVIISVDSANQYAYDLARRYVEEGHRIRVIRHCPNSPDAAIWNGCLSIANGKYIKFLHSDDTLASPLALSKMAALCEANQAITVAASVIRSRRANAQPLVGDSRFTHDFSASGAATINRCLLASTNLIGCPSAVMFRRSRCLRGFDLRFEPAADMEMWFHLLEQGCFAYLHAPLVERRAQRDTSAKDTVSEMERCRGLHAVTVEYLEKPYVLLRSSEKRRLVHEALSRLLRAYSDLGMKSQTDVLLCEYGRNRFRWECVAHSVMNSVKRFGRVRDERNLPPWKGIWGTRSWSGEATRRQCGRVNEGSVWDWQIVARLLSRRGRGRNTVYLIEYSLQGPCKRGRQRIRERRPNPCQINLMTFSFDYARRFYRDRGPQYFEGRHNIALWYWEQERFPVRLHCNYDYYDEIWAPTQLLPRRRSPLRPQFP